MTSIVAFVFMSCCGAKETNNRVNNAKGIRMSFFIIIENLSK
jgi:hypothetical protein